MGLIEDALARQAARPEPRRIDYDRMNKVHPKQKAALTRAMNAYRAALKKRDDRRGRYDVDDEVVDVAREKVAQVCKAAVIEWGAIGAWPDDWHRWQNALDDTLGWTQHIDLEDL